MKILLLTLLAIGANAGGYIGRTQSGFSSGLGLSASGLNQGFANGPSLQGTPNGQLLSAGKTNLNSNAYTPNYGAVKGAPLQPSLPAPLPVSQPLATKGGSFQQQLFVEQTPLQQTQQNVGPLTAAIQTARRTVEVRPVSFVSEPLTPQVIEVFPEALPIQVHFKSASSRVNILQQHSPSQSSQVEQTSSQEEPQRIVHEVLRPVIQEVREVIQPYRRVTQEVRPVIEEVHTVLHKGETVRREPVEQITQQISQQTQLNEPAVSQQYTEGNFGAAAGGLALNAFKGAKAAKA